MCRTNTCATPAWYPESTCFLVIYLLKYIKVFLINGLYEEDLKQFDARAKSISNFRFDGDNY